MRSPAAEEGQVRHYIVTLTEIERFNGGVETATLLCPDMGTCVGLLRVEVYGRPFDYLLSAVTSDDQVSLIFRGRTPITPALNHRQGYPVGVPLVPNGTGHHDVALAALFGPERRPTGSRGGIGLWLNPTHIPLANVRVAVRRESASEQSR